jgi:hypothetical protein
MQIIYIVTYNVYMQIIYIVTCNVNMQIILFIIYISWLQYSWMVKKIHLSIKYILSLKHVSLL